MPLFPLPVMLGALLLQSSARLRSGCRVPARTVRCFTVSSDDSAELLAREREVFRKVKPELQQGYRWLQKLENNQRLLAQPKNKRKQKKKKNKKKKKKKRGFGGMPWDMFMYDNGPACYGGYYGEGFALIGEVKSSFKLTAADIADLDVIEQPNPFNAKYKALQWVDLQEAAEIASEKHGGAAGFLDRLVRMAGVKNKQSQGRSRQKALESLKASFDTNIHIADAKAELRDRYHLPLYTNDLESLRTLNGTTTLSDKVVQACARRHFLMTFTEFPLIRNERSSLLMWISRYPDGVERALQFEALPKCLHSEVKRLWNEFFRRGDKATTEMPVARELESSDHQYNSTMLEAIDEASRERAQRFIDLGLPNVEEATLVDDIVNGDFPSIKVTFPLLFRVEWMPISGVGQGDLVFVNRDGTKFAVIEVKARTEGQPNKVSHVRRQSTFYSDALRDEFRHTTHQVYAGCVTDDGLFWLSQAPEDEVEMEVLDSNKQHLLPDEDMMQPPETGASISLTVESRRKELEAMTIHGGIRELLGKYSLPKTGRKADLIDRILKHEDFPFSGVDNVPRKADLIDRILKHEDFPFSGVDKVPASKSLMVAPSRREQLEAMNIEHELKALCYLYGLQPKKKLKKDYVETVWSHETSTPGISAGF